MCLAKPLPESETGGGVIIEPVEFQNLALKREVERLEQLVRNLMARNRLLEQMVMAFGDENRYYASCVLGRWANNNEAFLHFVENGGKRSFDQTHPS